jgi:hypothetical protein
LNNKIGLALVRVSAGDIVNTIYDEKKKYFARQFNANKKD